MFLDGTAAPTDMVRPYGRSRAGGRAHGAAPCGHWRRLTVIGAPGWAGVVAAMSIEAATSGAVFAAFLERALLPELRRTRPDAVLVTDNPGAHKTRAVRDLLERSGFADRYLPPYSRDLNPIEPAWARVKARLRTAAARTAAARTADALHAALGPALDAVTPDNARGYFRHAGYAGV